MTFHRDECVALGFEEDLKLFRAKLSGIDEATIRGIIGIAQNIEHSHRIRNRFREWSQDDMRYEVDPRHADILVNMSGVADSNSVETHPVQTNQAWPQGGPTF